MLFYPVTLLTGFSWTMSKECTCLGTLGLRHDLDSGISELGYDVTPVADGQFLRSQVGLKIAEELIGVIVKWKS
jgi:hypothetical protein